jgi:hypothetical protein
MIEASLGRFGDKRLEGVTAKLLQEKEMRRAAERASRAYQQQNKRLREQLAALASRTARRRADPGAGPNSEPWPRLRFADRIETPTPGRGHPNRFLPSQIILPEREPGPIPLNQIALYPPAAGRSVSLSDVEDDDDLRGFVLAEKAESSRRSYAIGPCQRRWRSSSSVTRRASSVAG